MRKIVEALAFHDPEQCLNRQVMYRTREGELELKPRMKEPINLCIGSHHTHTTWETFLQCQEDREEQLMMLGELRQFRGDEKRWCRQCTDFFAEHMTEECPREEGGNSSLVKLLEAKDVGLF